MKDTKKQREKDEPKVKTKSPHSIDLPSARSTSSSATASNVIKISKKSNTIQKRSAVKSNNVQTKLVSVKNENGTKSVIVSKVSPPTTVAAASTQEIKDRNDKRAAKGDSKFVATQVESKKTVDTRSKTAVTAAVGEKGKKAVIAAKNQKTPSPYATQVKHTKCNYCNLHFSTPAWLEKHIDQCHAKQAVTNVASKSDALEKIQNYKQQLENIQQKLDRKNAKQNKKRQTNVSPRKQRLREQLNKQLAIQQKLVQVQQEIMEKTSKAQQNIFKLISKLGDDDDDDDSNGGEDDGNVADQIEIGNVKFEDELNQSDVYIEDPNVSELIVNDNVNEMYEYLPGSGQEEQYIVDDEGQIIMNVAAAGAVSAVGDIHANMVVVETEDGDEEYELVDIEEEPICGDSGVGQFENIENGIDFEVIEQDTNSMHCRIVPNEMNIEEIEYVEVQTDQDEQQPMVSEDIRKLPIKLEVDKLQQIAQKRFKWQQQGASGKGGKSDGAEALASEATVLNTTIHKSEKQTNEYISKVVQNAIPTDDNKFECPICMELVSNRYSLGPHILRLHSKQKSKICQYCDRSFTCTGDLTRHIRIHTGEKPFKCTYPNCTYAFRASGDLHKHMRRHNSTTVNIRQHVCKQCDRAFERNYDLKRHELTHKKNEEGIGYTCEFCSKRFVRKDQHKAHVYRHLGIKQYKCPDCNRHFSDFSNCSKHIRQCQAGDVQPFGLEDIEISQYICDICNKRFKSKVGMKQHIIKCTQITEIQRKLQESFKEMDDD